MSEPDPAVSPLVAIQDKERALSQDIAAARERAKAVVSQAGARADTLRAQAERDGLEEAEALHREGLRQARREADEIRAGGESAAAALRAAAPSRIPTAVEVILRTVLPDGEPGRASPVPGAPNGPRRG